MINRDLLKYSLQALRQRKLRSTLTIVSIFIGITAIFTLVSFGQGLSSYVNDLAEEMGTDKIVIQPRGFGFGAPQLDSNVKLTDKDLDFLESVNGVAEATGMYTFSGEIVVDEVTKYAYAIASDVEEHRELIQELYTLDLAAGKDFHGDEKSKVLLGYNYMLDNKIFAKGLRVGDKVEVNGVSLKILGFYEAVGNPVDDANIYVTKDAAEELFGMDNYQYILLRSAPGKSSSKVAEVVKQKFRKHRDQHSGQEDFSVQTFEQLLETFTTIMAVINGVLILIALISVFVASVNIMNTMYTTVLERTKEIGVMKAIGAKNGDILFVFVLESGLLGLFGGFLGVVAGYFISHFAGQMVAQAGFGILRPIFTQGLIIGCLVFATVIGMLAGFLPAKRASQLNPVDALQYE